MEEFLNVNRVKLRNFADLKEFKFKDEDRVTTTSKEQVIEPFEILFVTAQTLNVYF